MGKEFSSVFILTVSTLYIMSIMDIIFLVITMVILVVAFMLFVIGGSLYAARHPTTKGEMSFILLLSWFPPFAFLWLLWKCRSINLRSVAGTLLWSLALFGLNGLIILFWYLLSR